MALLINGIDFIGRLGDITAYRMKGCKHTVLRRAGGPSAQQIKKDPAFKNVRLNGREFGGRAKAAAIFSKMLHPHKCLSNYNYWTEIASRLKVVQDLDKENALGQRSILFSRYADFWEGFPLNDANGFDSLVTAPVRCTLTRETLSAKIEIPALVPGVNLLLPESQALFRIQAALGILPDVVYQDARKGYVPAVSKERIAPAQTTTPWMPCRSESPVATLKLKLPEVLVNGGFALMVSIGIAFGAPIAGNRQVLPTAGGAAKVLRVQ